VKLRRERINGPFGGENMGKFDPWNYPNCIGRVNGGK
jgi:hypothetical protein